MWKALFTTISFELDLTAPKRDLIAVSSDGSNNIIVYFVSLGTKLQNSCLDYLYREAPTRHQIASKTFQSPILSFSQPHPLLKYLFQTRLPRMYDRHRADEPPPYLCLLHFRRTLI